MIKIIQCQMYCLKLENAASLWQWKNLNKLVWCGGGNYWVKERVRTVALGVAIMAQWKWIWLVSMRMRVPSLPSLSRLGIQHCCELLAYIADVALIPCCCGCGVGQAVAASIWPLARELSNATGLAVNKSKKKKKKKKKKKILFLKNKIFIIS